MNSKSIALFVSRLSHYPLQIHNTGYNITTLQHYNI